MAKITRLTQKVFASSAGFQEISQYGTLAAGSPAYSTDPSTVQAANWLGGWYSGILGGNSPAIEDWNAYCYLVTSQLAYLFQQGVAEWDSGTTYYTGSMATSSGVTYASIADTNLNNAVSDTAWWRRVTDQTLQKQIINSNGVFTFPAATISTTTFKFTVVGGGGGGGGGDSSHGGGGGGGGGGSAIKWLTGATAGNTVAIAIGAAGTAGSAASSGGGGGDTTVSSGTQTITTLTGFGGGPGIGSSTTNPNAGGGGGAASNGDLTVNGNAGGFSTFLTAGNSWGGAGGGAFIGGAGQGGTNASGAGANGAPGTYGGGGGGGGSISGGGGTNGSGGAGGAGIVLVEWIL